HRHGQGQAPHGRRPEGPTGNRVVTVREPAPPIAPTSLPRVVLAAPSTGQGQTTISTGPMAAHRARGLDVAGPQAGADYTASRHPSRRRRRRGWSSQRPPRGRGRPPSPPV